MLQEFDRAHNYLQDCFPSIIFYTVQLLAHTVYNEGGVILYALESLLIFKHQEFRKA